MKRAILNMKTTLSELIKNLKSECFAIALYIGLYIWKRSISNIVSINIGLSTYLNQDRLNGIAAFFAITIGVYVAVITVLATSEIGITREMLKRNLDKPLINVIMAGIIENFISVGLSIFIPINEVTRHILFISLIVSVISFVKFIILLIVIFKKNMEQMAKIIDEEEDYKENLFTYVEGIYDYCKRHTGE